MIEVRMTTSRSHLYQKLSAIIANIYKPHFYVSLATLMVNWHIFHRGHFANSKWFPFVIEEFV